MLGDPQYFRLTVRPCHGAAGRGQTVHRDFRHAPRLGKGLMPRRYGSPRKQALDGRRSALHTPAGLQEQKEPR
jgi:hypothetical protein